MQQEISSGSLTAFPHVGHLQMKEGKCKRENGWLGIFSKISPEKNHTIH